MLKKQPQEATSEDWSSKVQGIDGLDRVVNLRAAARQCEVDVLVKDKGQLDMIERGWAC